MRLHLGVFMVLEIFVLVVEESFEVVQILPFAAGGEMERAMANPGQFKFRGSIVSE